MAEELKEKKPTLQQKAPSGINGGKIQPGDPYKSEHVPVGINKKKFESDKRADKRLNKMFKQTNQPTLGVWNYDKKDNPMAKADKVQFNPALNKTKQINESLVKKPIGKPDPDFENRQKIMDQGFAPKSYNPKTEKYSNKDAYRSAVLKAQEDGPSKGYNLGDDLTPLIDEYYQNNTKSELKSANDDLLGAKETKNKKEAFWDRYNSLSDDQKKDFALNVYNHGTDSFDNPIGKFRNPYTGEIIYGDADNNYEDRSDYLLANDSNSRAQLEEAVNNLDIDNMSDEQVEKLFGEYQAQDIKPWGEESDIDPEYAPNDYSKEEDLDNQITDIETQLTDLENHAPYGLTIQEQQRQKELENKLESLKAQREGNEREQASKLFGTDLNKSEGNEPDTSPLDVNDMPGTPVITSRLKDFMRYYLKQEGISPEFSETMINNIGNNPRQADWFKQKMKEYVDSKNGGNK